MTPAALRGSGWPEAILGRVVAPDQPTYRSDSASDVKDFFVIDSTLADAGAVISCVTHDSQVVSKHKPVMLSISGICREHMIKVLKRLPRTPVTRIIGCMRPPVDWNAALNTSNDIRDVNAVTTSYSAFAELASSEILDLAGRDPADPKQKGLRSSSPTFVEVKAFGGCNGYPAANAAARLWRRLKSQVAEWLFFISHGNHAQARNFHGIAVAEELSTWLGSMALTIENAAAERREFSWKQWCKEKIEEIGAPAILR